MCWVVSSVGQVHRSDAFSIGLNPPVLECCSDSTVFRGIFGDPLASTQGQAFHVFLCGVHISQIVGMMCCVIVLCPPHLSDWFLNDFAQWVGERLHYLFVAKPELPSFMQHLMMSGVWEASGIAVTH